MNLSEGWQFTIWLLIVLIYLFYGAKKGGIALGLLGGIGLIVLVFACSGCDIRIFQRFKTGLELNQRVVQIVAAYPTEQKILGSHIDIYGSKLKGNVNNISRLTLTQKDGSKITFTQNEQGSVVYTNVGKNEIFRSGTTHIGKYVINHSFIFPGLIGVISSCIF